MAKKKKKAAKKAKKVMSKKKKVAKKAAPKKKVAKKAAKKVAKKKVAKKAAKKVAKKAAPKKKVAKKAPAKKAAVKKTAAPKTAPKKTKAAPAEAKKKGKASAAPAPAPEKKSKKAGKGPAAPVSGKTEAVAETEEYYDDDEDMDGMGPEEVILTDAEGRRYCRRRDCDQLASVEGYCRYHYLLFWKRIQQRKKILTDGKLSSYIEELTSRYPDKFVEMIGRDLRTEKDFLAVIQELEIDESAGDDSQMEEDNSIIDEVRGVSETSHARDDDDY